jgi:hypothetical protein
VRITGIVTSAAVAVALSAACDRKDAEEVEAPPEEPEVDRLAEVSLALEAIHEAVPAELAEVIRFEVRELEDGDLVAAVPTGWETGAIPWNYRPPSGEGAERDLGFHTQYGAGFSCAGRCTPKDWKDELEGHEFSQFVGNDAFELLRDERASPGGRLVLAKRGETLYLMVAWWKEGASRYAFCRATLDGAVAAAADAFVKACQATRFKL